MQQWAGTGGSFTGSVTSGGSSSYMYDDSDFYSATTGPTTGPTGGEAYSSRCRLHCSGLRMPLS